jgi:hypothetical protein
VPELDCSPTRLSADGGTGMCSVVQNSLSVEGM